jgi:hypothetical protein
MRGLSAAAQRVDVMLAPTINLPSRMFLQIPLRAAPPLWFNATQKGLGPRTRIMRSNRPLSSRARLAIFLMLAAIGWLAIIGIFFVGRHVADFIEAVLPGQGLNEIAPGGVRPVDR